MLEKLNGHEIVAEDDIWEDINSMPAFNEFIGKCVTHFAHFVIPVRDQTHEISELYNTPNEIDGLLSDSVELTRKDGRNIIHISYKYWF